MRTIRRLTATASSRDLLQFASECTQADRLDALRQRESLSAGIDDKAARRSKVGTGLVEALLKSGRQPTLDLDCPDGAARQLDHEIDIGAGGSPIEAWNARRWRGSDQRLDRHALPTGSGDGMAEQCFPIGDAEQGMHDAAVANVELRRLDQALAVQAAKAKARGYRTLRNLKAITYLIAGKLDLKLPT